jgi:plasmid maintenance system antidote protein VapI
MRSIAPGTSAQLWMNLQNRYDVEVAKRAIGKKLDKIEPVIAPRSGLNLNFGLAI